MSVATNRVRASWHLRKLGWRVRPGASLTQSIKDFQRGYTRANLKVDGVCGKKTMRAILESSSFRSSKKKGGTASWNFDFKEFACKCNGRYSDCRRIWVERELVQKLEQYRSRYVSGGMYIVSGCRCQRHNRFVGGAASSQHVRGTAADIVPVASVKGVRAMMLFKGIGYAKSNKRVCHVDVRRGGSVSNPATWEYPNW